MAAILPLQATIVRTSLADDVYERVFEAIVSGALASGNILHEVGLAAQLSVSRTPVHEALRRLAADGLVEHLPNKRARVATFSRQTLTEIYELRKLLERAAAEKAAMRLSDEKLRELRAEADALNHIIDTPEFPTRALAYDVAFHDAMAHGCGNEHLRKEISKYRRLVKAFCRLTGKAENLKDAFREHLQILEALEAHDGARAGALMASHIDARLQVVLKTVGDAAPVPVPQSSSQLVSV